MEDWRSNFDMNEESWFDNFDWSYLFPNQEVIEGVEYTCDDYDVCWYFDDSTQMVCFPDGQCYSPEEALDNYF